MSSKGLPPRWKNCPRFGDTVANIFVPFKVPLDESFGSQMPATSYFTPSMFINYMKSKKTNIGLWVDLTYTNRFYDNTEVEKSGISYVKLKCRGFKECPNEDQTKLFIDVCENFLNKNPNSQIAVHCTHGFNRTGFLICSYLVIQESWSVEAAISAFAKARPTGIYKQDYIDELFRRFGDIEDKIKAPELPDWCNEDSEYNDDEAEVINNAFLAASGSGDNPSSTIEGMVLLEDPEKIKHIRKICTNMCKFRMKGFPGSQPVSLSHDNISLIRSEEYLVSWKADGTRYMMLIMGFDEIYLFDRDYQVFQLFNVKFLRKTLNESITETLLDGEMVVDVVNGKSWPRYLIYDIVYFDGEDVSAKNFRERLNIIFKQVIYPRETAKRSNIIDRSKEPIGIRLKDFCELKATYKFFSDKFTKVLSHEIDGLIFQPVNLGYIAGRCDKAFKWKPPSHNSVDFRLRIVEEKRHGMLDSHVGNLYVGGQDMPFSSIRVTKALRNYNNKIIECRFNMEKNQWEFMRERTDKSYPNALTTAKNVCNSIRYPITRQYLLDFINK